MIRRRRPRKGIEFSFDSFLDLVTNVVGIIIRLILVSWVGARSYQALVPAAPEDPAAQVEEIDAAPPLSAEMRVHRKELNDAQERLLEQLRRLKTVKDGQQQLDAAATQLSTQCQQLEEKQGTLKRKALAEQGRRAQVVLSLPELQRRGAALAREIAALEKLPPLTQKLRYGTPVSRPVHAEEVMFECLHNKVTVIDIGGLLAEVKQGMEDKGRELRMRWQVEDVAGPLGAFRLRYTIERIRTTTESIGGGGPEQGNSYSYGLGGWKAEPIITNRGEALESALAKGSEFRRTADGLQPNQAVATFWVYPDSFPIYRALRDYLHARDVEVAGRPLTFGSPIAGSRNGTRSQGQ
jgi:hypothetical protein